VRGGGGDINGRGLSISKETSRQKGKKKKFDWLGGERKGASTRTFRGTSPRRDSSLYLTVKGGEERTFD